MVETNQFSFAKLQVGDILSGGGWVDITLMIISQAAFVTAFSWAPFY